MSSLLHPNKESGHYLQPCHWNQSEREQQSFRTGKNILFWFCLKPNFLPDLEQICDPHCSHQQGLPWTYYRGRIFPPLLGPYPFQCLTAQPQKHWMNAFYHFFLPYFNPFHVIFLWKMHLIAFSSNLIYLLINWQHLEIKKKLWKLSQKIVKYQPYKHQRNYINLEIKSIIVP